MKSLILTTLILAMLLATAAAATTIQYSLTKVLGQVDTYRYDWTVINASVYMEDFIVFFSDDSVGNPWPEATNLAVGAAVRDGWNEAVAPPWIGDDVPTPMAGYCEAWADPGAGIAAGDSLGGFSATFTWTGGLALPGTQYFEIYDSNLECIGSGTTERAPASVAVPEWGSMSLCLVALGPIGLAIRRRRR